MSLFLFRTKETSKWVRKIEISCWDDSRFESVFGRIDLIKSTVSVINIGSS